MSETSQKGDLGEAMVTADCIRRGYQVALPLGEDWRCDLIVLRKDKLERIQVKYCESDGKIVDLRSRRDLRPKYNKTDKKAKRYDAKDIDWFAVYDKSTNKCYYIPINQAEGKSSFKMRLVPPGNKQQKLVKYAKDYEDF